MDLQEALKLWEVGGAKLRIRLHVEKFDMTGDEPSRVEYIVVDDEGRTERPEG